MGKKIVESVDRVKDVDKKNKHGPAFVGTIKEVTLTDFMGIQGEISRYDISYDISRMRYDLE